MPADPDQILWGGRVVGPRLDLASLERQPETTAWFVQLDMCCKGWLSPDGTTSLDLGRAHVFTRDEAAAVLRRIPHMQPWAVGTNAIVTALQRILARIRRVEEGQLAQPRPEVEDLFERMVRR